MRKIFVTLLILMSIGIILADQYAYTEDGKKVLLKSDGTWEYVKERVNSNSPAPLKILETKIEYDEYRISKRLIVVVKNISNKTIRAYKLEVDFYDDFGDKVHTFYKYYTAQELNLRPNQIYGKYSYWTIYQDTVTKAIPRVVEVVFANGSRWEATK